MIKEKITSELKSRFIEDIKRTIDTGKERGFFLCENKERKLIPSKSCEGTECDIKLGDPRTACPPETKAYGEFHTHPYLSNVKKDLREKGKKIPTDDVLRKMVKKYIRENHEKITGVKGMTINSPSYTDVLKALISKSVGITNGVVCISTDVEIDNVECWKIKDMPKDRLEALSVLGMKELDKVKPAGSQLLRKWIDNISDRETINLK